MTNQDDFGWQRNELVRSGLFVEDDRPGSRLRLAWQGSPPRAALRLWGALVLAAAIIIVSSAAAGFFLLRRGNPLALDELGVAAADAVFIDNKPENVLGAETLGITGHVFTSASGLRAFLESLA